MQIRKRLPEKAISGRTRRSRFSGLPLARTRSALVMLLSTSLTWGLNWRQAILILGDRYELLFLSASPACGPVRALLPRDATLLTWDGGKADAICCRRNLQNTNGGGTRERMYLERGKDV